MLASPQRQSIDVHLSGPSNRRRPTKAQFRKLLFDASNHIRIVLFGDLAGLGARAIVALGVLALLATRLVLVEDGLALVALVEGVLLSESVAWVTVWVLGFLRSGELLATWLE